MRRVGKGIGIAALVGLVGLAAWLAWPATVMAHCDTLGGPVVTDARAALESSDVTPALKWIRKESESEIRAAFEKTLAVRSKGADAKELADTYFFETLVRLHRAGEGEPYTGLKAAGEIEPPIAAADKAIAGGNVDGLAREIGGAAEKGIRERFEKVVNAEKHKNESVEAGREYVEAYVTFIHYVEGLHTAIVGGEDHH